MSPSLYGFPYRRLALMLALLVAALLGLTLFARYTTSVPVGAMGAEPEVQQGYIFRFDPGTTSFVSIPIPLPGNGPVGVVAVNEAGQQHIWFTQSDTNLIGRLIYTSTTSYSFNSYTVPTANSLPLNITSSGDSVWFTEHAGNRIGRVVRATGAISEYVVPTANSGPADIDAAPNGALWFSEQAGNKLASLNPASGVISEYVDLTPTPPSPYQPYGVFVQDDNHIWVAEPRRPDGIGWVSLLQLFPSQNWLHFNIGPETGPWDLVVDGPFPSGTPWVLERYTRRICELIPGTLAGCFHHHNIGPTPGVPTAIVFDSGGRWFTKSDVGQLGRMTGRGGNVSFDEYPLPVAGLWPQGLDIASDGRIWIVAGPRQQHYLPMVFK